MAQIIVSPEELDSTGTQFNSKSQELQAMVQQANSLVQSTLAGWKGQRASKFSGDWEGMKKNLEAAVQTLQQTSELLKRAAADFRSADTAG
ncbi:MAG: hypothetical protein B6D41_08700 [Chloroflexi bacterium UTCFX4]|nr:MAG: hypothetical protein B6D41_08700 [Chloroflexi bacterium UTCFX4]